LDLLTSDRARNILEQARDCRVVVLGDVMLDEFLWGDVSRISPEAPVPVRRVKSLRQTLGGAANTAANITIENSIVADNTDSGGEGNDCFAGPLGSLALRYVLLPSAQTCSARFNPVPVGLLGVSPAPITPLVYHGGTGRTHDLLAGTSSEASHESHCTRFHSPDVRLFARRRGAASRTG